MYLQLIIFLIYLQFGILTDSTKMIKAQVLNACYDIAYYSVSSINVKICKIKLCKNVSNLQMKTFQNLSPFIDNVVDRQDFLQVSILISMSDTLWVMYH